MSRASALARNRRTERSASSPQLGGGLTAASAAHESPYGRIESSWRLDGDTFHLEVLIPPGTTAEVVLPGDHPRQVGPGRHKMVRPTA